MHISEIKGGEGALLSFVYPACVLVVSAPVGQLKPALRRPFAPMLGLSDRDVEA